MCAGSPVEQQNIVLVTKTGFSAFIVDQVSSPYDWEDMFWTLAVLMEVHWVALLMDRET